MASSSFRPTDKPIENQLTFYKMLMNLGLDENGVQILKEETVTNILAQSTRPKGLGSYSLGLAASEEDKFFKYAIDSSDSDAYTRRIK